MPLVKNRSKLGVLVLSVVADIGGECQGSMEEEQ